MWAAAKHHGSDMLNFRDLLKAKALLLPDAPGPEDVAVPVLPL